MTAMPSPGMFERCRYDLKGGEKSRPAMKWVSDSRN
jgi:hypothetical protein